MSRNIYDLFDAASTEEASELLRGVETAQTDEPAEARIEKAVLASVKKERPPRRASIGGKWARRAVALAAAAAILTGAVFGAGAYAEAKEYREAKSYLNGHSIVTENLTRDETKLVYKDISEGAFELPAAREAMDASYLAGYSPQRSLLDAEYFRKVGGTGEKYSAVGDLQADGSYYVEERLTASDPDVELDLNGMNLSTHAVVRTEYVKYRFGREIWRYGFDDNGAVICSFPMRGGLFLARQSSDDARLLFLKLVDGEEVWHNVYIEFPYYFAKCTAWEDADGGISFMCLQASLRADGSTVPAVAARISPKGKLEGLTVLNDPSLLYMKAEAACSFEGGWALVMSNPLRRASAATADSRVLAMFDGEGNLVETVSDPALGVRLDSSTMRDFVSIRELGGRLYLSCHDMDVISRSNEPAEDGAISLEFIQIAYVARLIAYDPAEKRFEECVSEPDAMAGTLNSAADGSLVWNVKSISYVVDEPSLIEVAEDGSAIQLPDQADTVAFSVVRCTVGCDIIQFVIGPEGKALERMETQAYSPFETTGRVPDGYSQLSVPQE